MKNTSQKYFSVEFIEEGGKTFVIFYDSNGNLIAKSEIPHRDINEAMRVSGEDN